MIGRTLVAMVENRFKWIMLWSGVIKSRYMCNVLMNVETFRLGRWLRVAN